LRAALPLPENSIVTTLYVYGMQRVHRGCR